jgi:alpha-tubulin suppressor-like RCC1 family protein
VFTINGSNFTGDATVKFIDSGSVQYSASVVTVVSATQITATTPQAFTVAQGPLSIRVSQASGIANSVNSVTCGTAPSWSTAAGSVGGTIYKNGSVSFSVSATDSDAGSSVTYSIYSGALPAGLSLNSSTGEITGTAPGVGSDTTYNFTIRATDNGGNTADRAFSMVVLVGVPGAPTVGSATVSASQSVQVAFTAPGSAGGSSITSYTVTSSPGSITATGSSSPITVTGLTNGTAYTFTVTATNSYGTGAASSASNSATPAGAAGAPTIGSATASGSTRATVTFTAPANDGGSTITSYTAVSSPGGRTGTLSQAGSGTITITGLTASTSYTFTVYATNSYGNSASSSASNSITTSAPPATNGKLYTWGSSYTPLGLGTYSGYSSPMQVGALTTWKQISQSDAHMSGIQSDGTLWMWGSGTNGNLGLGNTSTRRTPVQVGSLTNWSKACTGGNSYSGTLAVKTNGTLWAWGNNNNWYGGEIGNLGLGNTTNYSSPKQIGSLTTWAKIAKNRKNGAAIKTDGTLWMWGNNDNGQLGDGTTTSQSSPIQVGSLTTWSEVAVGINHVAAVQTDGTLWTWGDNVSGQLGYGGSAGGNGSSPAQVGSLTDWLSVSCGGYYRTFAIKTDGTLWSWGSNDYGQLGLGYVGMNNTDSPRQVGALTSWSAITAGNGQTMALRTDGTLWMWGRSSAALGLGATSTNYSSPKQIGSLTTWISITEKTGRDVSGAIST